MLRGLNFSYSLEQFHFHLHVLVIWHFENPAITKKSLSIKFEKDQNRLSLMFTQMTIAKKKTLSLLFPKLSAKGFMKFV